MTKERLARLRLIRSQNVGPATFRLLLNRFGSAEKALNHLPELSARAGGRRIKICSQARAEQEIEQLEKLNGSFVMLGDENYPESLSLLEHEPPVLSVLGHSHLLRKPSIGIVGTRNASASALMLTKRLASELNDYIVISGLALGIDGAAHKASLQNGTTAVLAGGVDVIYPPEHTELYHKIIELGCIVSEMPLGTQPSTRHFPRRNRVISGLSLAIVVVEAPLRSGAMITARAAAEQGRLVCAVPGNPLDPRAKGTNKLLRDGATLIETSEDILHEVSPLIKYHLAEPEQPLMPPPPLITEPEQPDYDKLLNLLGPSSVALDDLIRLSDLSPHLVNVIVADLEIAGRIHRDLGNKISVLN